MGQPGKSNVLSPCTRYREKTPDELKHLSSRRKRNQRDSLSSGERNGRSPNLRTSVLGGCGPATRHKLEWKHLGRCGEESETLVHERVSVGQGSRVPQGTRNPVGSRVDHHPRLNTSKRPIAMSTVRER